MLQAKIVNFSPHIQAVFIQNSIKLFAVAMEQAETEEEEPSKAEELMEILMKKLPLLMQSGDLEVQERVRVYSYAEKSYQGCNQD